MGNDNLNNVFYDVVRVVNASCVQTSTVNTAAAVQGSKVTLEAGEVRDGTTYRWQVAGTLTGGNAAFLLTLVVNGATVLTLTSDAATAADWAATIVLRCYGGAVQKIWGSMTNNSEDPEVDYAAGTSDLRGGATMQLFVTSGNSGDTVTSEVCTVETWIK